LRIIRRDVIFYISTTEVFAMSAVPQITEEEYLIMERASESKHEYIDGEILAMGRLIRLEERRTREITWDHF